MHFSIVREARTCVEEGLAMRLAVLDARDQAVASSLTRLAVLKRLEADYDGALGDLDTALRIRKELGDRTADVAEVLHITASVTARLANFVEARAMYDKAYAIKVEVFGEKHLECGKLHDLHMYFATRIAHVLHSMVYSKQMADD